MANLRRRARVPTRTPPVPAEIALLPWFWWLAAGTSGLRLND